MKFVLALVALFAIATILLEDVNSLELAEYHGKSDPAEPLLFEDYSKKNKGASAGTAGIQVTKVKEGAENMSEKGTKTSGGKGKGMEKSAGKGKGKEKEKSAGKGKGKGKEMKEKNKPSA